MHTRVIQLLRLCAYLSVASVGLGDAHRGCYFSSGGSLETQPAHRSKISGGSNNRRSAGRSGLEIGEEAQDGHCTKRTRECLPRGLASRASDHRTPTRYTPAVRFPSERQVGCAYNDLERANSLPIQGLGKAQCGVDPVHYRPLGLIGHNACI
jgi:hypothetical protein